jgi:PIN domain nuclease of toxin-antitoxin system
MRFVPSNRKNSVQVSSAVIWDTVIKKSVGKLDAPVLTAAVLAENSFLPLPIRLAHALALQSLPAHHKDPFDRMLIAQAMCEGLTIVTRDPMIPKYDI